MRVRVSGGVRATRSVEIGVACALLLGACGCTASHPGRPAAHASPTRSAAAQGMQMPYKLEFKNAKWAVVARAEGDASGHGTIAPGAADPHSGGAAVPMTSGGKMPSPNDLPPAGKKK